MHEITMENINQHQAVRDFIQGVVDKLYTSEDAFAIEAELKDHILSLSEDYLAAGHSRDAAIRKALLQMGDPGEIGYSFTDFTAMKRRKLLRVGLKWAAVIILLLAFAFVLVLAAASDSGAVSNSENDSMGLSVFYMLYMPFIVWLNLQNQGVYRIGIPVGQVKLSKAPLMILWPYKQRFQWEYLALGMFFVPIIIVFMIMGAYEGGNPLAMVAFVAVVAFSIWLFFFSERFRIPKYMLLEEGLVIKNRLVSWTAIDRISWTPDYLANSHHYVLTLEHVIRNQKAQKSLNDSVKTKVYVNNLQYRQLNAIIKQYLS